MFMEVELIRVVRILAKNKSGLVSNRSIMTSVLKRLLIEKVSKEHGYFIAITNLKSFGKRKIAASGDILCSVTFDCRTFIPFVGDNLQGVVQRVNRDGVILRIGPLEAYLSSQRMPGYRHVPGENPVFMSDKQAKIEKDTVLELIVIGAKWFRAAGEFKALVSIDGDDLGPGCDELPF